MYSSINKDFLNFSKLQIYTNDIDPAYPYIKYYIKRYETMNEKIRFILDYMSSYSLGSALYLHKNKKILLTQNKVPLTGVERRGNRGVKKMEVDLSQNEKRSKYVLSLMYKIKNYSEMVNYLSKINNYGRWASFKLTEILDYVFDLKLNCDNLFTEKGSGHTTGLNMLTGLKPTENLAKKTFYSYRKEYDTYKYQNFETSLCDWHNFASGKYYVGNDIDLLKEHLTSAEVFDKEIHKKLFPNYPVEHNEKPELLRKVYKNTGKIKWWS